MARILNESVKMALGSFLFGKDCFIGIKVINSCLYVPKTIIM